MSYSAAIAEPENADTPLDFAVAQRDRDTLAMVEKAVRAGNVRLAYQPIVSSAAPDRPAFFEGFVRVLDDTGRTIPAREFINVVETHEIGRILDCHALALGFRALSADAELKLAINLSARSIGYRRWLQTLESGLSSTKSIAGRLVLEITEASAMVMPDVVEAFMSGIQGEGVTFALDDFGAGHTSFRYLKSFSFDMLKIDGQFVRGIDADPDNQVLMRALVDLGQHLGMYTIAESVETAREAAYLSAIGVDCMQGYLYGAPAAKPAKTLRKTG